MLPRPKHPTATQAPPPPMRQVPQTPQPSSCETCRPGLPTWHHHRHPTVSQRPGPPCRPVPGREASDKQGTGRRRTPQHAAQCCHRRTRLRHETHDGVRRARLVRRAPDGSPVRQVVSAADLRWPRLAAHGLPRRHRAAGPPRVERAPHPEVAMGLAPGSRLVTRGWCPAWPRAGARPPPVMQGVPGANLEHREQRV